jgi:hypothetical protein
LVNEIPYQSFTASVTNSINLLNAFTSSQQPTFNALNSFTASQLVLNTGYNAATYSLNVSVNSLTSEVDQLQTWSGSVNEIQSAGVSQGYATRFNFSGLMTASITPNVNGAIADISLISDNTRVATSSFNPWSASINSAVTNLNEFSSSTLISITNINQTTASLNSSVSNLNQFTQSQITINNSTTAAINNLNTFTSSFVTGYVTDVELAAATGSLINSINTKLNTSSFNDYTASQSGLNPFTASINSYTASNDTKWTTIGLLTGSYATTGSNSFSGSQTITGSVLGNVSTLSITSQTASMDLSKGNFFTLTLVSGSATHLTATNIKAGQTINLLITQSNPASGSLTYNSTIKFPAGNAYVATQASSSKDIITFITFDDSTIYAAAINNLV